MSLYLKAMRALPVGTPDDWKNTGIRVAAALLLAAAAREILKASWEKATGEPAPENPSIPSVSWRDAIIWGVLTGALAGLAKVLARRGTDVLRGVTVAKP